MKKDDEQPEETRVYDVSVPDNSEDYARIPEDELEERLDAFIGYAPGDEEKPMTPEMERILLRRALLERSCLNGNKSKKYAIKKNI